MTEQERANAVTAADLDEARRCAYHCAFDAAKVAWAAKGLPAAVPKSVERLLAPFMVQSKADPEDEDDAQRRSEMADAGIHSVIEQSISKLSGLLNNGRAPIDRVDRLLIQVRGGRSAKLRGFDPSPHFHDMGWMFACRTWKNVWETILSTRLGKGEPADDVATAMFADRSFTLDPQMVRDCIVEIRAALSGLSIPFPPHPLLDAIAEESRMATLMILSQKTEQADHLTPLVRPFPATPTIRPPTPVSGPPEPIARDAIPSKAPPRPADEAIDLGPANGPHSANRFRYDDGQCHLSRQLYALAKKVWESQKADTPTDKAGCEEALSDDADFHREKNRLNEALKSIGLIVKFQAGFYYFCRLTLATDSPSASKKRSSRKGKKRQ